MCYSTRECSNCFHSARPMKLILEPLFFMFIDFSLNGICDRIKCDTRELRTMKCSIADNSRSTCKRGTMEMNTSNQCPVAGCGETGVKLSPHLDPFGLITFDRLAARPMELACPLHSEILWERYRKEVSAAMMSASRRGTAAAPTDSVARVSWRLNSHNDPTSKAIASLLALGESHECSSPLER